MEPNHRIEEVKFKFYTSEEIKKLAVVEITN